MDTSVLAQAWPFIRPRWGLGLTVIALSLIGAFTEALGVSLLLPLVQGIVSPNTELEVTVPALGTLIEKINEATGGSTLILAWLVAAVVVVRLAITLTGGLLTHRLQWGFISDMRAAIYERLLSVSYSSFTQQRPSDLVYAIQSNVVRGGTVVRALLRLVHTSLSILILLAMIVAVSVLLSLVTVVIGAVITVAVYEAVRRTRRFANEVVEGETSLAHIFSDGLGNMRLIRTYSREDHELDRFLKESRSTIRSWIRKFFFKDLTGTASEAIGIVGLVSLLSIGIVLVQGDVTRIAPLVAILTALLLRVMPLVSSFNGMRAVLASEAPELERALHWLHIEEKVPVTNGSVRFQGLRHGVRLEDVTFTHETRSEPALENASLDLPYGSIVALVGASGAGKSTLADLICRLYDPQEGRVLADGVDLRDLDLASWRASIGIVSQESLALNASIFDNIRYGRLQATNEEVIDAAAKANIEEFVHDLPDGYDTMVGDRGVLLSGGQRQRIAIGRAVLRDPQILILDEATSALDSLSERLVQETIDSLRSDRVILIIAHRLSTIRQADRIAVLERGRVVETGLHGDLIQRGGAYAALYEQYGGGDGDGTRAAITPPGGRRL